MELCFRYFSRFRCWELCPSTIPEINFGKRPEPVRKGFGVPLSDGVPEPF